VLPPRTKRSFRKYVIVVLLIVIAAIAVLGIVSSARIYTGVVYTCAPMYPPNCAKEPLAGTEVYLLSGIGTQSSPTIVLQVTRSDAAGRYWFLGAPPGAVAAVRVGNYEPVTWMGPHAKEPYCAFAAQWMPSHDIELLTDPTAIIGDFGGLYQSLTICPEALR